MGLTSAYLTTTKNLDGILMAMGNAQAPPKFTTRFLASLGYKSPNDRLIIGVLKGLGFLDDAGSPTERYFKFLDQGEAKHVLADGIRAAYEDLFALNVRANEMPAADVKNKLKTLTQGQKSDQVLRAMASTFTALCGLADWSKPTKPALEASAAVQPAEERRNPELSPALIGSAAPFGSLCYKIELVLPPTRDPAVYDALFKSLKEHLLR